MDVEVTPRCRVVVPRDTLAQLFTDEAVLLSLANERYYSLDDVGTEVWRAVTSTDSLGDAIAQLLARYDVDEETLRDDVVRLVRELVDQGLVQVVDASG